MKHTKGEWKLENWNGTNTAVMIDSLSADNLICETYYNEGSKIELEEAEANAKLIASAPKMHEELTEIVEYINKMGVVSIAMQVIKNRAKEALKATE